MMIIVTIFPVHIVVQALCGMNIQYLISLYTNPKKLFIILSPFMLIKKLSLQDPARLRWVNLVHFDSRAILFHHCIQLSTPSNEIVGFLFCGFCSLDFESKAFHLTYVCVLCFTSGSSIPLPIE